MQAMISPPFLATGDKVGLVAPARKINPVEIEAAIGKLESWGLMVVPSAHMFNEYNQFSGTDEQRIADFQQFLDDPDIRCIFCVRGGYGTVRIIDSLDFSGFVSKPKWIAGFSDVTVLHSHVHSNFKIRTLHCAMPVNSAGTDSDNAALESVRNALFGAPLRYEIPMQPLNRSGSARGIILGGNLSILHNLAGTVSDIETSGKILFIEDVDEYLYHIDRMMLNLKRTGKLKNLAGLVVGAMTKMNDNDVPFGKSAEAIVAEAVQDYSFPVCFGFPSGHIPDNRALILGAEVNLEVGKKVMLEFIIS